MPRDLHPWLQFQPNAIYYNMYCERFLKLRNKQFICPRNPDWRPLEEAGIAEGIRSILTTRYDTDEGYVLYEDWEKLFALWYPIYKELCFEFLSTIQLKENVQRVDDRTFMNFMLGEEVRIMSILDMAACLRIYTAAEMETDHFAEFLNEGFMIKKYKSDIWEDLSETPYNSGMNLVTEITDVKLRVIQRFLSHTINSRGDNTERVNLPDMWYLEKLNDNHVINIPYCVAWFLFKKAAGKKPTSPICGGHFITAIARYYNINVAGLTVVHDPRIPIGAQHYINVGAIKQSGTSFLPVTTDEPQSPPQQRQRTGEGPSHSQGQEEEAYEDQGGFQQPSPPQQHFHGPDPPNYQEMMSTFQNWRVESEYRQRRTEYSVDWLDHNASLYFANPTGYTPTPHQWVPHWDATSSLQPPPMYDQNAALEEARRLHQEQYEERQAEERYHEEQRRQEHGGFHHDFWPF